MVSFFPDQSPGAWHPPDLPLSQLRAVGGWPVPRQAVPVGGVAAPPFYCIYLALQNLSERTNE